MKVIVIGHRQPDLDSIVSALVYAEFLKAKGSKNIVAGYCDTLNNETKYILEKFEVNPPSLIDKTKIKKKDQVILVDHNEESQRLEGIDPNQIVEIVDHHKANLGLNQPIKIDIRPWGSTSTILYNYFTQSKTRLDLRTKQLILAAILSDTVGLKAATTTDIDRKVVKKLATDVVLDIEKLTLEIFKAKSKIDHLTPKQIVMKDYKIFNFGGKKVFINQVETIEQEKALKGLAQLVRAMEVVKKQQGMDYIFCLISDILKINSKLIFANQEEQKIAEAAFGGRASGGVLDIGPKLSRKKEIIPFIKKIIEKES